MCWASGLGCQVSSFGFIILWFGFWVLGFGFYFLQFGVVRLGFGFRVWGCEAPIVRLIMASLREIPTDLIVIARAGKGCERRMRMQVLGV